MKTPKSIRPPSAAALVACLFTLVPLSAQAQIRLGLDTAPYPPFYEKDATGKLSGFEIDLGEAICAVMEEECVWTAVAWDGIIPALLEKKIDVIFGSMSRTEERMKVIDFSDKYYDTPAVLVARKGSDITTDPASLAGKIIGVQVATTHANYVDAYFAESADAVKIYQAFDEQNNDLVAGRVDAVVGHGTAFAEFFGTGDGAEYEIKGELSDPEIFGAGIGVGLRQGEDELKQRFNDAIAQIRQDGTYQEIAARYFDFDIYGQ